MALTASCVALLFIDLEVMRRMERLEGGLLGIEKKGKENLSILRTPAQVREQCAIAPLAPRPALTTNCRKTPIHVTGPFADFSPLLPIGNLLALCCHFLQNRFSISMRAHQSALGLDPGALILIATPRNESLWSAIVGDLLCTEPAQKVENCRILRWRPGRRCTTEPTVGRVEPACIRAAADAVASLHAHTIALSFPPK